MKTDPFAGAYGSDFFAPEATRASREPRRVSLATQATVKGNAENEVRHLIKKKMHAPLSNIVPSAGKVPLKRYTDDPAVKYNISITAFV